MANTSPRLARAVPAKQPARNSVSKHAAKNSVSKYTARSSVSKLAARNSVLQRCPNTGLAYTYGADNKKYDAIFPRSFKRDATVIVSAEGQYLLTEKGKRIFTASGGAAVSSLGPAIDERFEEYMRKEIPYINASWAITPGILDYAGRLLDTTDGHMKSCRFYNGGGLSVEASLKLALQYQKARGHPERNVVIGREQSYHGSTLANLALGGHRARREPFEEILMEVKHAMACNPWRNQKIGENDEDFLARLVADMEDQFKSAEGRVAAVFLEPVVGAALGCMPPVRGYLEEMRRLCDKYDALLIFDEIMCGMGRLGTYLHAYQHWNVVPDILLTGKGMAGGHAPLSAMLMAAKVYDGLRDNGIDFNHGNTFENLPRACAAGMAMLDVMESEDLLERAATMGRRLMRKLIAELGNHPRVGDIRGLGLFIALEIVQDIMTKESFHSNEEIARKIWEMGLDEFSMEIYFGGSSNGKDGDYLMLSPAFTITKEEVDFIAKTMGDLVRTFFERYDATH